jgi:hypothetical protein
MPERVTRASASRTGEGADHSVGHGGQSFRGDRATDLGCAQSGAGEGERRREGAMDESLERRPRREQIVGFETVHAGGDVEDRPGRLAQVEARPPGGRAAVSAR